MNTYKLIQRSIKFYSRVHTWVALGTLVSAAIIVGTLILGDSIRFSLSEIVNSRLGRTEFAVVSGERYFRTKLAFELSEKLETDVAPLLRTNGIAIVDGGKRRLNKIQVLGVNEVFDKIGRTNRVYENLSSDEAVINLQVAERLGLKIGDEFLLRMEKLDYIPKDVPIALDSDVSMAKRYTVKSIATAEEFGSFNLNADQIPPYTIFVSLKDLGQEMGIEGKSNIMLAAEAPDPDPNLITDPINSLDIDIVNEILANTWTLADAELKFAEISSTDQVEMRTERIFLESSVVEKIDIPEINIRKIFTYFVNEIGFNDRSTSYSFVSAVDNIELTDGEIIINEWLAKDLNARTGDRITLKYFVLGESRTLEEAEKEFTVKRIVPIEGVFGDRMLMPDFPGLSDKENCRDWDPGIPVDLEKIRDKDEDYWDKYKGTPKAFIGLNAAQNIWQNRYGKLTAVRFAATQSEQVKTNLKTALDPADIGLFFSEVKQQGLAASSQSVDFAGLFLGLSFFIIVASLLLTGLLFAFNIEQRSEETGLYLALGFPVKMIKNLVFLESAVIVVIGSLAGAFFGILYNQIVFAALKTIWSDIIGTSALQINIQFSTVAMGTLSAILITLTTIRLMLRSRLKQPAAILQKGIQTQLSIQTQLTRTHELRSDGKVNPKTGKRYRTQSFAASESKLSLTLLFVCVVGVLMILGNTDVNSAEAAFAGFFTAGFLVLTGCVAFANLVLKRLSRSRRSANLTTASIGIRNNIRKRSRSLTLMTLLASGIFITFAVGANRKNAIVDAGNRESGTGGFALFGESVLPVLYDLNTEKGREFYALNNVDLKDVKVVPFRVKEGDDASCLNLNRVSAPQIIGVDPNELSSREAFSFAAMSNEMDPLNPWEILNEDFAEGVIPGIADQSVILWGLGKSVGDTLTYTNENGKIFKLKLVGGLVNSIFQGNVIISEKAFIKMNPSISGSKHFLIDAPQAKMAEVAEKITWAMMNQGMELTPAHERLAHFNSVENTYLSIFLILGTLGLMLGSVGIGIVIRRNVAERRGELALLRAVGFKPKDIQSMILSEHAVLLAAGILFGILTALFAVYPAISAQSKGADMPIMTLLSLLAIVILNCGFWTYFSVKSAVKTDLMSGLRNE